MYFLPASRRGLRTRQPLAQTTVWRWGGGGRRTLKHVGHLADLGEGGAVGPGVHHVHQVGLELVQVRLLVHLQLGVRRHLGDALGTLLTTAQDRQTDRQTDRQHTDRRTVHTVSTDQCTVQTNI